ncbi:protein tyrosine phosphatase [Microbulbifer sp. ZKSA006]|uniref:protein-tyrosine phosphatase family protein n=1 Tax=Microbulbifer sp. ZKSA006 TaxID=3243390 RepID=UPI004039A3C0
MIPNIYSVCTIGAGKLYVMPKPSSDYLEDDVRHFISEGVDTVVSLLEESEESELGLKSEGEILKKYGIKFIRHSIRDRGLPASVPFGALLDQLYGLLTLGSKIAVHCRAGIGRTGMVAPCLLVKEGVASQEAIDTVSAARGVPVPDTQEQYDFICDYELGSI